MSRVKVTVPKGTFKDLKSGCFFRIIEDGKASEVFRYFGSERTYDTVISPAQVISLAGDYQKRDYEQI